MSNFPRQQRPFICQGVCLTHAIDDCPVGKYPQLENVRSLVDGTINSREGLTLEANGAMGGGAVYTIFRLNDPTPFAAIPARVFYTTNTNMRSGPLGGPYPVVDAGWSGFPTSCLAIEPPGSPQPWLYAADASRMRKFNVNGLIYPIGIAPPAAAPVAVLYTIGINLIAEFNNGTVNGWASVGTGASALGPLAGYRVNTTIAAIYYDTNPAGNSWASIVPAAYGGISEGMMVLLNGVDLVQVGAVTIPISATTIASIVYDAGASGLCTIQPAASLGTGQIDAPSAADNLDRGHAGTKNFAVPRGAAGIPNAFGVAQVQEGRDDAVLSQTRLSYGQRDFPVNALVTIGGAETVRILSVATGPDEVQSFRCSTVGTFAAGAALTGVTAFRAWVPNAYAIGNQIVDGAVTNTITPSIPAGSPVGTVGIATAGIQSPTTAYNLAQVTVGGVVRSITPEDDLHLSIRAVDLAAVQTVRVYFDVDRATNDFTQNYYFFEWRANDLIAAVQATNFAPVETLSNAAATAASLAATAGAVGRNPDGSAKPRYHGPHSAQPLIGQPAGLTTPGRGTAPATPSPIAKALALGNNQWIDLRCKIKQLIHVGTDLGRTLAHVQKVEVLVAMRGLGPVTIDYDCLYISGGFGADVDMIGNSYRYRYSYRSSTTGAPSNPSPATTSGVLPHRQRVILTGIQSADPQVDLVDWWRMGGSLLTWTYNGTTANVAVPTFNDDYGDNVIDGGKSLEFDNFQPWPSTDLPRTGTVNVAGTAVRWVSGDAFNVKWSEGSNIIILGRTYTLAGPPPTSTLLFLNENAGSGAGVTFFVPSATLIGQTQPILFGGPIGNVVFTFGLGDIRNPGTVTWTKGNNPDVASDKATLAATAPSDPLINGCLWDGLPYVFSADNQYVLEPDFANPWTFRALITPCGRGLWCAWAMAPTPYGIAFLAKDGIFITRGGGTAESLTDKDLYPLFPHDGVPGRVVNGQYPVNMTLTARMRLTYIDGWLYFDYQDTLGQNRNMAYRFRDQSWWPDQFSQVITCRYAAPGTTVHTMMVGDAAGNAYQANGLTDNGNAITSSITWTENTDDRRQQKLYRDAVIDMDAGAVSTFTLGRTFLNGPAGTVVFGNSVMATVAGRKAYYFDSLPTTMVAYGVNLQLKLSWVPNALTPMPVFYGWDVAQQANPELATNWLSGPTTHGLPGYQQVPLVLLAYLSTGALTLRVIIDGVTYSYALPNTGGLYLKKFIRLQAVKGLTFQYGIQAVTAQAAFMLFDLDCEVWVQPWGFPGSYQRMKPFSNPSIGVAAGRGGR